MSDTAPVRPRGAMLIPWVAALLGFAFQIIWFSSQFGSLTAKVEDADRRVAFIEQNGSPSVQATRTEVSINSRRLTNLEEQYGSKVSNLLTSNASQVERLNVMQSELDSLRQWRLQHVHDDGGLDGRIAALDRQVQQIQTEHTSLTREVMAIPRPKSRP